MEVFKLIAETNNWKVICPEVALGILALAVLMLGVFIPRNNSSIAARVSIIGQLAILAGVIYFKTPYGDKYFGGLLYIGSLTQIMRIFFIIASLLVSYLAYIYFEKNKQLARMEFFHIVLITTAALMLFVESNHFVLLFVSLETATVGLLVLVSYCKTSSFSLEAGLKYLVMAALSSSILLFGIVLLYGVAGNPLLDNATTDPLNFSELANFIEANSHNLLVKLGVVLVISGIAFKMGVFPFQIWIPDVYQGAPTPVTAFLAVSSKAAAFFVLIHLISKPFAAMHWLVMPLLASVAVITILFANIAALPQTNVKRLMGLSGISHAGYLLIGVIASYPVSWAIGAIVFYLFTYLLSSFAVFSVMTYASGINDEDQQMEHYENFSKNNPFLGKVLLVGLGSLAGIPPLAGFIGKLLIFIAAYQAGLYTLLAVAILGVVISIYYYFGWMRDAFFYMWKDVETKTILPAKPVIALNLVHRIVLGVIIGFTLILGVFQGAIGKLIF